MPSKTHSKVRQNPTKEKAISYFLDLKEPIDDGVFDIAEFENHLKQSLKLNGKKGLGEVEISSKDTKVTISTKIIFSKRYIKYLAKKYLKKQDLRDFLRVVATDKNTYSIKFFNIHDDAAEGDK